MRADYCETRYQKRGADVAIRESGQRLAVRTRRGLDRGPHAARPHLDVVLPARVACSNALSDRRATHRMHAPCGGRLCRRRWLARLRSNARKYLLARTERDRSAFVEHHCHIQHGKRAGAVRYDDDDAPVAAQGLNSMAQGILAVGVEVRIRLIEDNQERVAESDIPPWPMRVAYPCGRRRMMSCTPAICAAFSIASDVARSSNRQIFSATVPSSSATS